jgi:hypothetical protein
MAKPKLLPSRITIQHFTASALVALLLSGGACYELPTTISSAGIQSSDLVPNYWLRESIDSCEMIFDKPRFNLKSNSNKRVDLISPAKFTFKGKPLVKDIVKTEKDKIDDGIFVLPCENGNAEFVVTDDRGGERRDKLNLSKIKIKLPQTPIDRSKDLKIAVLGAGYPKDTEIKSRIDSEIQGDGYDDMMMDIDDYKGDPTRITFDKNTQTLTIPTQILKRIKTKQPILRLEVKTSLYYEYPDKHGSPWFQYEYWTPKQKLVLK